MVDLYLAFNNIKEDTISEVLQNWAYGRFSVITWAWGVLAGHLFLTRVNLLFDSSNPILVLVRFDCCDFRGRIFQHYYFGSTNPGHFTDFGRSCWIFIVAPKSYYLKTKLPILIVIKCDRHSTIK